MDVLQEDIAKSTQEHDREKQAIEHMKRTMQDKSSEISKVDRSISNLHFDEKDLPRLEERLKEISDEISSGAAGQRGTEQIQQEMDVVRERQKKTTKELNEVKDVLKCVCVWLGIRRCYGERES